MRSTTRQAAILESLKRFGDKGLTNRDLMNMGGGNDVRKRISELRRNGYAIKDQWVQMPDSRVKKYILETR